MESSDSELNDISAELKQLSLRRHQLLEKKKFKNIIDELKSRNGFKQPGNKWKMASKRFLQRSYLNLLHFMYFFLPEGADSNNFMYFYILFFARGDKFKSARDWQHWWQTETTGREEGQTPKMPWQWPRCQRQKQWEQWVQIYYNCSKQIFTSYFAFVTTVFFLCQW